MNRRHSFREAGAVSGVSSPPQSARYLGCQRLSRLLQGGECQEQGSSGAGVLLDASRYGIGQPIMRVPVCAAQPHYLLSQGTPRSLP